MKIATWNVNSVLVRLPHLLQYIKEEAPDILVLQETKTIDANFPQNAFLEQGYHCFINGQKTYNGVAVISKYPGYDLVVSNPYFEDEQRRILKVTIEGIQIFCLYVPNGAAVGSDKFYYKLAWLQNLTHWVEEVHVGPTILLGDFNIAPTDDDVYDPKIWHEQILCSTPERDAFKQLLALNLVDSFRLFPQLPKSYSWWDYRNGAFSRNLGLRIDHILISQSLVSQCTSSCIHRGPRSWDRPSDHAPVMTTLAL